MKKWMLSTGWIVLALCFLLAGCSGTSERGDGTEGTAALEGVGGRAGDGEDSAGAGDDGDSAGTGDDKTGAGAEDGKTRAEAGEGSQAQGAGGTGEGEAAQEKEEQSLYGIYIQIGNQMVGHLQDVIGSYYRRVDFQEAYTLLDEEKACLPVGDGFYELMGAAMEQTGQMPEGMEGAGQEETGGSVETAGQARRADLPGSAGLDEAYRKLYPVMWELAEALDQAETYIREKAYQKDDHEEGKRIHQVIWKATREYEILSVLFLEELDKAADAWEKEELRLLQEKGLEASYAIYAMIGRARELREAIDAQGIDDRRIAELDIQALQPVYEQYVEETTICLGYLEDGTALKKEGYPAGTASMDAFKDQVIRLSATLEELFRQDEARQTTGGPLGQQSGGGGQIPGDGLIYRFEKDLGDLIDGHNALFDDRG